MKKKKFIIGALVLVFIVICGVLVFSVEKNNTNKIVSKSKYHKVISTEQGYKYWIYDKKGNVVKEESMPKAPEIEIVEKKLLKVTVQTGTEMETQWGYYFDTESGAFSEIFHCIFDQTATKVVYAENDKIVIRDIYAIYEYYYEISEFKKPFSDTAFPFVDIKFTKDEKAIEVTYMSGKQYNEIVETIKLYD